MIANFFQFRNSREGDSHPSKGELSANTRFLNEARLESGNAADLKPSTLAYLAGRSESRPLGKEGGGVLTQELLRGGAGFYGPLEELVAPPGVPSSLSEELTEVVLPSLGPSSFSANIIRGNSNDVARSAMVRATRDAAMQGVVPASSVAAELIGALASAAIRDKSASVRALAVDALAEYALQPSEKANVHAAVRAQGVRPERLIEDFLSHRGGIAGSANPDGVSASIRLADALGVDGKRIRRLLAQVALHPEKSDGPPSLDRCAIAFQALEARQGIEAVHYFGKIAISERENTSAVRTIAVAVLGVVSSGDGEPLACEYLKKVIASVPARNSMQDPQRYPEAFALGGEAVRALLSQYSARRVGFVVDALGHQNVSFRERVAQSLVEANRRGTEITVPLLRWMDAAKVSSGGHAISNGVQGLSGGVRAPLVGVRILQQLDDAIVVPVLLGELEATTEPHDSGRLAACVSGLKKNLRHFYPVHVEAVCELMRSEWPAVQEAAAEVYAAASPHFSEGIPTCLRVLHGGFGSVSPRLAEFAISALHQAGREEGIRQIAYSPKMPHHIRSIALRRITRDGMAQDGQPPFGERAPSNEWFS